MLEEVEKFINHIRNYKLVRKPEVTEYDTIFQWHKNRIKECYSFLKYLNMRRDFLSIRNDYKEIEKLTREVEQNFLEWKNKNVEPN